MESLLPHAPTHAAFPSRFSALPVAATGAVQQQRYFPIGVKATDTRSEPASHASAEDEEDDLLFGEVDGLRKHEATPNSGSAHSLGALKVPSEEAVSDEAAQVLEALRSLTTDADAPDYLPLLPTTGASDEGYLLQLGQALAARVPFVRFALRTSAPKRPSSPARDPSWALRTLRHTMLVGTTIKGEELLVETSFRAHFSLPGASTGYTQLLLGQVPDLVVLPAALLKPLVQDLAQRLATETAATGRALPPWRTSSALLSKWLPSHFADTPIRLPTSFAPAAPAPAVSTVLLARAALEDPAAKVHKVATTPSKVVRGFDAAPAAAPVAAAAAMPVVAPTAPAAPALAPKPPTTEEQDEAALLQLSSGTASPAGSSPDSVLPTAALLRSPTYTANDTSAKTVPNRRTTEPSAGPTCPARTPPGKDAVTKPRVRARTASPASPAPATTPKKAAVPVSSVQLRAPGRSSAAAAATTFLSLGSKPLATHQRLVLSGRALRRGGAIGVPPGPGGGGGGVGKRVAVVVPLPGGVCGGACGGEGTAAAGVTQVATQVRRHALVACGGDGTVEELMPKVHKVIPAGTALQLVAA